MVAEYLCVRKDCRAIILVAKRSKEEISKMRGREAAISTDKKPVASLTSHPPFKTNHTKT